MHLADGLSVNTGLEMLLLADNPFGDEGGRQLSLVLSQGNRSLRVLDLHGTHMSKPVEKEMVMELHKHSSLTKLGSDYGNEKGTQYPAQMEGWYWCDR